MKIRNLILLKARQSIIISIIYFLLSFASPSLQAMEANLEGNYFTSEATSQDDDIRRTCGLAIGRWAREILPEHRQSYQQMQREIQNLERDLQGDMSDIVVLSLGVSGAEFLSGQFADEFRKQIYPPFIQKLAQKFPHKTITIYQVAKDPLFDFERAKRFITEPNVTLKTYQTYLPSNRNHSFTKLLEEVVADKLRQNKVVILGNFTRTNFEWIPTISELFSHIKFSPKYLNLGKKRGNLFMFTHLATSPWFTYATIDNPATSFITPSHVLKNIHTNPEKFFGIETYKIQVGEIPRDVIDSMELIMPPDF